jgi:hypothetical protein
VVAARFNLSLFGLYRGVRALFVIYCIWVFKWWC